MRACVLLRSRSGAIAPLPLCIATEGGDSSLNVSVLFFVEFGNSVLREPERRTARIFLCVLAVRGCKRPIVFDARRLCDEAVVGFVYFPAGAVLCRSAFWQIVAAFETDCEH